MTFHGVRVNVGTHVQRQWIEGAVSEGLGEEQLQGGQVGQEGLQVWGLQREGLSVVDHRI